MKKYKVQLTPRARASIDKIVGDLRRFGSPTYATKVRREIIAAIKSLKTFPEAHQAFGELTDEEHEYRRALILDYKIVFTVKDEVLEVIVVQVYNQQRGQEWIDENVKP
jgi:plasmid stabilization system protein ParE